MVKTRLCNRLTDVTLAKLMMRIALEKPEQSSVTVIVEVFFRSF